MNKPFKPLNKIFYLCPDMKEASGGINVIYEHVIELNKNGHNAYVVHLQQSFGKIDKKFGKDIKYLKFYYLDKMFKLEEGVPKEKIYNFMPDDIIVIPEGFMNFFQLFKQFEVKSKKVLFAQGWSYIIPSMMTAFKQVVPFAALEIDKVMTVSDKVTQFIKDLNTNQPLDEKTIVKVPNYIDPKLFNTDFGTEEIEEVIETEDGDLDIKTTSKPKEKKNKIAFMPRKGADLKYFQAISLAQAMGKLNGWEVSVIAQKTPEEVAELMKESKIFLNYTDGEGFGLPPLEALMCGCQVVGNAGLGSEEYLLDTDAYIPIEGDLNNPYNWLDALEKAIKNEDFDYNKGFENDYTKSNFSKELLGFYNKKS
jgi:hypothetical protein